MARKRATPAHFAKKQVAFYSYLIGIKRTDIFLCVERSRLREFLKEFVCAGVCLAHEDTIGFFWSWMKQWSRSLFVILCSFAYAYFPRLRGILWVLNMYSAIKMPRSNGLPGPQLNPYGDREFFHTGEMTSFTLCVDGLDMFLGFHGFSGFSASQ